MDPLHKLRERYEGPYVIRKQYDSKCLVQPFKNEDIQKEMKQIHILGHGRPQLNPKMKVVCKDRLKKINGFKFMSTALGKDLKSYFIDGTFDLYNLEYTYRNMERQLQREKERAVSAHMHINIYMCVYI